ncbi:hypothetical protein MNBD_ACTINO02-2651 [hydrothermal vent metagenome]|uniref:Heavy metal-binding domain-containing protein n=1 Tax=hydrothermal vent metagenome TaxID=652676 RepID=A0A3B0TAD3_9ZZZZ
MAHSGDTVRNGVDRTGDASAVPSLDPFGTDTPVFNTGNADERTLQPHWEDPVTSQADGRITDLEHIDLTGDDPVSVRTTTGDRVPAVVGAHSPTAEASVPAAAEQPIIRDLRSTRQGAATAESNAHYGLGRRWGSQWTDAAQGWVTLASGQSVWRPVVTTTETLPQWDTDTYLGVVTAEVAVDGSSAAFASLGETLARARQVGIEGLTEEAIDRGAHAVIGVTMSYTALGNRLLITLTGTAVTLREKA